LLNGTPPDIPSHAAHSESSDAPKRIILAQSNKRWARSRRWTCTPEKARAAIRAGATEAVRRAPRLRPYLVRDPVRLEADVVGPDLADLAALRPGVTRLGPRSVAYEATDMLNVMMTRSAV
jgi:D-aminopeptidase